MNTACSICLEVFSEDCEISSTPCGHIFHSICIKKALEVSKTCPQCRKICSEHKHRADCRKSCANQIHRVYLPSASEEAAWIKKEKKLLQMAAEKGSLEW